MFIAISAYLGHLLGTLIAQLGFFLQKIVYLQLEKSKSNETADTEDHAPKMKKKPVYCRLLWVIGFICLMVGGAIQFFVLPYADLVLISTNRITGMIFNTFISIQFLDEKF